MWATFLIHKTTQNEKCQNINDHGIHGTILVTDAPRGSLGAEVSQDACMDVITQVGTHAQPSDILIRGSGTDVMTCARFGTSVRMVVVLESSCPTLTTTRATGSRPMLYLTLIQIAAKPGLKIMEH